MNRKLLNISLIAGVLFSICFVNTKEDFNVPAANAEMTVKTMTMGGASANTPTYSGVQRIVTNTSNNKDIQDIKVNLPVPLSYKSKDYVYNLRKTYVSESIFANPDYTPSDAVFGQIESNRPWIASSYQLKGRISGAVRTDGTSEESRFINNPSMLVALIEGNMTLLDSSNSKSQQLIQSNDAQFIPRQIQYDKKNNEIIVTYNWGIFDGNIEWKGMDLNGVNARDLGYPYVYLDKSRTTLEMVFQENNNVSNTVYEFQDFLHTGGGCGVAGGCNNGSPYQPMLTFNPVFPKNLKSAEIYLKLWKNNPSSYNDTPDITERIVITR